MSHHFLLYFLHVFILFSSYMQWEAYSMNLFTEYAKFVFVANIAKDFLDKI